MGLVLRLRLNGKLTLFFLVCVFIWVAFLDG